MKVFDCFLFFNELDLLELRLETLYDKVDFFIISECKKTFSGNSKPLYFLKNKENFQKYKEKIIHNIVPEENSLFNLPKNSKNLFFTNPKKTLPTKHNGKLPLKMHHSVLREIYQRDAICLGIPEDVSSNDLFILSDVDEIPNPVIIDEIKKNFSPEKIYHLEQDWFVYWINNKSNKKWYGSRVFSFSKIALSSFDNMRQSTEYKEQLKGEIITNGGWHFSYLGGEEKVKTKLESLAYQGRRETLTKLLNKLIPKRLNKIILNKKSLFFKNEKFNLVKIDKTFPRFITNNLKKYNKFITSDN